jgi:N-acetylglucosaminyl-diphospho-decaprenol L-rhamnosyltransferase
VTAREQLDVEISLVNHCNRDLLRQCLTSLRDASRGLAWSVSVVDNASDDGSVEMVAQRFPWARLHRNQRQLGFSANHNQLICRVLRDRSARYVLILNEDTVLRPGSVSALVAFADDEHDVGAIGPIIRRVPGDIEPSFLPFPTFKNQVLGAFWPRRGREPVSEEGWLNGACVLLRLEALLDVGPLDECFFAFFEDTDLGLRLARAGWRSVVCESAEILHYGHASVAAPSIGSAMERQMLRSRYLYFRKHYGVAQSTLLVVAIRIALLARALKAFVTFLLRRNGPERDTAAFLWDLAQYNPTVALPHETHAMAR